MLQSNQTVAEIAVGSLAAVRILERHGIDYCCGGKQSLDAACAEKGVPAATVLAELEQAAGSKAASDQKDWLTAPLTELARHITETHHEYLRRELPAIRARMEKVVQAHGAKEPEKLPALRSLIDGLIEELEPHMMKEEMVLFPFVAQIESAIEDGRPVPRPPFGTVANPIRMMEHEHDNAGGALLRMRELTGGYALPEHACNTYRALYQGLQELEADLHLHIHLENNILFPRAQSLEAGH